MGMEFSNNQASSKRIFLPLELDLNNMSNPSVILESLDNDWRSDNRQAQTSDWMYFQEGSVLK